MPPACPVIAARLRHARQERPRQERPHQECPHQERPRQERVRLLQGRVTVARFASAGPAAAVVLVAGGWFGRRAGRPAPMVAPGGIEGGAQPRLDETGGAIPLRWLHQAVSRAAPSPGSTRRAGQPAPMVAPGGIEGGAQPRLDETGGATRSDGCTRRYRGRRPAQARRDGRGNPLRWLHQAVSRAAPSPGSTRRAGQPAPMVAPGGIEGGAQPRLDETGGATRSDGCTRRYRGRRPAQARRDGRGNPLRWLHQAVSRAAPSPGSTRRAGRSRSDGCARRRGRLHSRLCGRAASTGRSASRENSPSGSTSWPAR